MAKLEIVYQDQWVVAVNKPAGLAVIPGRTEKQCVLTELGKQLNLPVSGEADPRLRVVHRLDKDTSGVVLFAKNIEAQRHLSHQFQNNTVRKEYLALVVGRPPAEQGEIEAPLAPDRQVVGAMKIDKRGKPAITLWKLEETFRGYSLVRAFPKTGKTHQIRVHLKHIGHPLAVDSLYGPAAGELGDGLFLSTFKRGFRLGKFETERPLISRLTLHAHRLAITNVDGSTLELSTELPKDFRAALNMLRKYGR